jgi:hypothetical protein
LGIWPPLTILFRLVGGYVDPKEWVQFWLKFDSIPVSYHVAPNCTKGSIHMLSPNELIEMIISFQLLIFLVIPILFTSNHHSNISNVPLLLVGQWVFM